MPKLFYGEHDLFSCCNPLTLIQIMLAINVLVQFRTSEPAQNDQFCKILSTFDASKYQDMYYHGEYGLGLFSMIIFHNVTNWHVL